MKRVLRIPLGLALLIGLIIYSNPSAIINKLADLNKLLASITALIILISTLTGAYNAYLLVNLENEIKFYRFIPLYWLSSAVGLVFPGQIGDITMLSAIMKQRGLKISQTVGRSLTDKLVSLFLMLVFGCWGVLTLPGLNRASYSFAMAFIITIPFILYWQRLRIEKAFQLLAPRSLEFFKLTFQEIIKITQNYPRRIIINMILTSLKIILAGGAYWCIFQSLGQHNITLWQVIPLAAASSIVAYLPISFNGLGTVEIAGVVLFSTIGINESTILSAYLILRLLVLASAWLPIGLWLVAGGQSHR